MKKTQKGFTLVELVVVIAIIGVLAAILVPSMLNYVKKSRLKTANANAKTAYNAAAEILADAETQGWSKASCFGTTTTGGTTTTTETVPAQFKITVNSPITVKSKAQESNESGDKKIAAILAENGDEAGVFKVTDDKINGQESFTVYWAKTTADEMVGMYPDAITWDEWKAASSHPGIGSVSRNTYKKTGTSAAANAN